MRQSSTMNPDKHIAVSHDFDLFLERYGGEVDDLNLDVFELGFCCIDQLVLIYKTPLFDPIDESDDDIALWFWYRLNIEEGDDTRDKNVEN